MDLENMMVYLNIVGRCRDGKLILFAATWVDSSVVDSNML